MAASAAVARLEKEQAPIDGDLIDELFLVARRDGLTLNALSRRIGVDHAQLIRARNPSRVPKAGHARLGLVSCARVVQVYPELSDAAARYLAVTWGWPAIRALAMLGRAAVEAPPPDHA